MNPLKNQSWSPYLVGVGIGLLSWFSFATVDRQLGITTAFEYSAALTEQATVPQIVKPYLEAKAKDGKAPKIDWEWMLVLGVFIGAYASSKMSGDRAPEEKVPPLWGWRFGYSPAKRYLGAFFGGLIMMLGARIAQGCTSGHGISGILQLALSSWLFAPVMGVTGMAVAFLIYGKEGRRHV